MLKSTFSKTAIVLAAVMMSGMVSAKELKIAVVDAQEVFTKLPQTAKVEETLKKEFGPKQAEMDKLKGDFEYNREKLKRDGATMSEKQKKDLEAQLAKQYQTLQATGGAYQEAFSKRQNEETRKIGAVIEAAVKQVVAAGGYDLVLSKGATVHAAAELDITQAVIAQASKAQ